MPQRNSIAVDVYPVGADPEENPLEFSDVHYISFVSSPGGAGEGTYGVPAVLSDNQYKSQGLPMRVLYVNPHRIVAMLAERIA